MAAAAAEDLGIGGSRLSIFPGARYSDCSASVPPSSEPEVLSYGEKELKSETPPLESRLPPRPAAIIDGLGSTIPDADACPIIIDIGGGIVFGCAKADSFPRPLDVDFIFSGFSPFTDSRYFDR
jgi:hypothetical protein